MGGILKPGKLSLYLGLVRFSHTFFALPFALASLFMAARGLPGWKEMGLILLCMVTARNSAMAFNRWLDADIDAQNPRTKNRHIPGGMLSRRQVAVFTAINLFFFVAGAWFLNPLAFILSFPTAFVLLFYSFWKRWSFFCHFWLGISIGLSPLGAWVGIRGELDWFPLWLGLALCLWIAGFDMIYALMDEAFDRAQGLHSAAVAFGSRGAQLLALVLHVFHWVIIALLGYYYGFHWPWWIGAGAIALMLIYIHKARRSNSLDSLNSDFFIANVSISIVIMILMMIEVFYFGTGAV